MNYLKFIMFSILLFLIPFTPHYFQFNMSDNFFKSSKKKYRIKMLNLKERHIIIKLKIFILMLLKK